MVILRRFSKIGQFVDNHGRALRAPTKSNSHKSVMGRAAMSLSFDESAKVTTPSLRATPPKEGNFSAAEAE